MNLETGTIINQYKIISAIARVVELRYFSGLSNNETAEIFGVSNATVRNDCIAKAWIKLQLTK